MTALKNVHGAGEVEGSNDADGSDGVPNLRRHKYVNFARENKGGEVTSMSACLARSLGNTWPGIWRLMPHARSAMSTTSCTSPRPSLAILPISIEMSRPRGSMF